MDSSNSTSNFNFNSISFCPTVSFPVFEFDFEKEQESITDNGQWERNKEIQHQGKFERELISSLENIHEFESLLGKEKLEGGEKEQKWVSGLDATCVCVSSIDCEVVTVLRNLDSGQLDVSEEVFDKNAFDLVTIESFDTVIPATNVSINSPMLDSDYQNEFSLQLNLPLFRASSLASFSSAEQFDFSNLLVPVAEFCSKESSVFENFGDSSFLNMNELNFENTAVPSLSAIESTSALIPPILKESEFESFLSDRKNSFALESVLLKAETGNLHYLPLFDAHPSSISTSLSDLLPSSIADFDFSINFPEDYALSQASIFKDGHSYQKDYETGNLLNPSDAFIISVGHPNLTINVDAEVVKFHDLMEDTDLQNPVKHTSSLIYPAPPTHSLAPAPLTSFFTFKDPSRNFFTNILHEDISTPSVLLNKVVAGRNVGTKPFSNVRDSFVSFGSIANSGNNMPLSQYASILDMPNLVEGQQMKADQTFSFFGLSSPGSHFSFENEIPCLESPTFKKMPPLPKDSDTESERDKKLEQLKLDGILNVKKHSRISAAKYFEKSNMESYVAYYRDYLKLNVLPSFENITSPTGRTVKFSIDYTPPHVIPCKSILKRSCVSNKFEEIMRSRFRLELAAVAADIEWFKAGTIVKLHSSKNCGARNLVLTRDESIFFISKPHEKCAKHSMNLADVESVFLGISEEFAAAPHPWLCFSVFFTNATVLNIECPNGSNATKLFMSFQALAPLSSSSITRGKFFWLRARMRVKYLASLNNVTVVDVCKRLFSSAKEHSRRHALLNTADSVTNSSQVTRKANDLAKSNSVADFCKTPIVSPKVKNVQASSITAGQVSEKAVQKQNTHHKKSASFSAESTFLDRVSRSSKPLGYSVHGPSSIFSSNIPDSRNAGKLPSITSPNAKSKVRNTVIGALFK